jgi:hypothetical protein
MPELLNIGDLVQRGTYSVHSRFRRAVNFHDGDRLATIVAGGMDAGPVNIAVHGFDAASVRSLRVEPRAIVLDGERLPFDDTRVYLSSIRLRRRNGRTFLGNLGYLGGLLTDLAPRESLAFLLDDERLLRLRDGFERELADHVRNTVRDILYYDRLRGVSRLKGCGVGLTPSGDDFIAGFLIGLNVLERLGANEWSFTRARVLGAARRGNILTDTMLYLAEEGRVTRSMNGLISSLDAGSPAEVRAWTERVLSFGGTSGADTAVGFYLTVREGLARRLKRAVRPHAVLWDSCRYDVV